VVPGMGNFAELQHNTYRLRKKFATSTKWAKKIILLTWELIHHIWLERNNTEHDSAGCPKIRRKEKLIETIRGESEKMNFEIYTEEEISKEKLLSLPVENLNMLKINLKNVRSDKRSKNSENL
jgi:hypothetical protein